MIPPVTIDYPSTVLFLAAIAGGITRAAMGKHPTVSRRTMLDVLVGGCLGVIFPMFGVLPTAGATWPQLAAIGFIVGLFGSYFLAWGLYKFGVFKDDVRAAKPDDGNGGTS